MRFHKIVLAGFAAVSSVVSVVALGADAGVARSQSFTPYGYVGGSIGRSDYAQNGCVLACDDRATGFKLYSGGQSARHFSVELAYVNLGKVDRNGGDVFAQGLNLSLVGHLPLGDRFKLLGKLGSVYGYTRTRAPAGQPAGHEDSFRLSYGLGMQFDLNPSWAVRGEWERLRFEYPGRKDDADLYTVGVVYKY